MNTTIARPVIAAAAVAGIAIAFGSTSASALTDAAQTTIKGTVAAYDGKYDLRVQRKNGTVDDVRLHRGTIINPTGLTLRSGMQVTVQAYAADGVLAANEIDTPYHITQPAYAPAFYPAFYPASPYGFSNGFYPYGGPFGFGFGY